MKTIKIISAAVLFTAILITGCSKDYIKIEGTGPVISKELSIDDFTSLDAIGKDDIYIQYGSVQKVVVKGHSNIIPLIKTRVIREKWDASLEDGRYGDYELTYYITLPKIEEVKNTGTGNIVVESFIPQEKLFVSITGTGNFSAFPLTVKYFDIEISGQGNCEISVENQIDAKIIGTGNVYYKGTPLVKQDITGTGSVTAVN